MAIAAVKHCMEQGGGVVALCKDSRGPEVRRNLKDCRGGVVFPSGGWPGYFLLMGREFFTTKNGKNGLLFLSEGESIMHESLFSLMTDDCAKFKVRTLYAALPITDRHGGVGGFDDLFRWLKKKGLNGINLTAAPSSRDGGYGDALIKEYWMDGALDIQGKKGEVAAEGELSTLRKQLRMMFTDTDVNRAGLYAVEALRYLIAGYVKYENVVQYKRNVGKSPLANPKGWT